MRIGIISAALLVTLAGCANQAQHADSLNDIYLRSIAAAAVKSPDYARNLRPIDTSKPLITVAHIQPYPTIDGTRFTWVSQPDDLRSFCRGKADPLLAMQQALGLPPQQDDKARVFVFDVPPSSIFRPCASSPDIAAKQCSLDLPVSAAGADPAAEHFVLKQIMDSYRRDGKYPGYPFTAMGWSYDWDPGSATHQGVSEYVVKPGSPISHVTSLDPAAFCNGGETATSATAH